MNSAARMTHLNVNVCYTLIIFGVLAIGGTVSGTNTTSERRNDIVDQIGEKLCPFTDYCRRQKTYLFSEMFKPCCADCYCGDDCWKFGNCCPDKEVIDEREPLGNCHVSIVKQAKNNTNIYNGINYGLVAYRIIDDCPESEQNLTIINKCTLSEIDHVSDYSWVSDDSSELIYQNKFCALCHGVEQFTEWQLQSRCEELIFSDFAGINSLLLSDKCDIINKEPYDRIIPLFKRCVISIFTRCNQTGLWEQYDPDIEWACNVHDSVFIVEENNRHDSAEIKSTYLYKNAFCYACNSQEIEHASRICGASSDLPPTDFGFSAIIDYKRNDNLERIQANSNSACQVNEIMDPYLQKCRSLICPFLNFPFYGECKELIRKAYGLSVEVIYKLSSLWSSENYSKKDKKSKLRKLGKKIMEKLSDYSDCTDCYKDIRLATKIIKSKSNKSFDDVKNTTHGNAAEADLLFYKISPTHASCPLSELIQNAVGLVGSVIVIEIDGTVTMLLKIELLNENDQRLIDTAKLLTTSGKRSKCFVSYRLTTEKICPKIRVSFAEFTPFLAQNNTDIIKSMFTDQQRRSDEYEEICAEDYLEKLSHVDIKLFRNSGNDLLMKTGVSISDRRSYDVTLRTGSGIMRRPEVGYSCAARKYVRTLRHDENRCGKCRKCIFL